MKTPLWLLGFMVIAHTAQAEIVTFRVDGTLTSVSDPSGIRPISSEVGDAYSMVYSFESTTPGHQEGTTPSWIMRYNALTAMTLFIGTETFELLDPRSGVISITNDFCAPFSPCEDGYHLLAGHLTPEHHWFQVQMGLGQQTPTPGSAIPSLALPLSLDRSAFSFGGVSFQFSNNFTGESAFLDGSILEISEVPIPAAAWLLMSAPDGWRRAQAAGANRLTDLPDPRL